MKKEEIEITIEPNGAIAYTIRGVKGPACEDISALLEQLGTVTHEERTGDYYDRDEDSHLHIGDG